MVKKIEEDTKPEDIQKQRINDLKDIVEMRGGAGIRVLRRIMADAGIFRSAYRGNAETNYILGRQSMGTQLIIDLENAVTKKQLSEILL